MFGNVALVGLTGAIAQTVDGMLGMGYGVSASSLLLFLGVAPVMVSATVHGAKLPSGMVSGLAHLRQGNVSRAVAAPLAGGGALGAVVGAALLTRAAASGVRPLVAAVLLVLGVRMVIFGTRGRRVCSAKSNLGPKRLAALGFVGGAIDAFGGGGWGPTATSVLMSSDSREPRVLIGSVNLAEVAPAAAALATFSVLVGAETFMWAYMIPLVIGGALSAPLAARLCARVNGSILSAGVGAALVLLNLVVLSRSISALPIDGLRIAAWLGLLLVAGLVAAIALRSAARTRRVEAGRST